jgi:serine/threonine protein kinase/WD40 repeat protein
MDDHIETIGLSEHAQESLRRASVEITTLDIPGYEVQEEIGRGTYGVVWRATRLKTGQEVAIKVLDESKGLNWDYFRRELALLIDLEEHPHTLTILDAQLDSSPPLIVMPLAEGGSLETAISNRGFSVEQKEQWIQEMAEALDFIHSRGVIHSDLKPSNVLLSSNNTIRIADFGQARRSEQEGALGTLGFMPPEQCEDRGSSPSIGWDVYGFGATAYWMLTGELPRYRSGTSGGVAEYVEQLKAKPIQPIRKLEPEVDPELASIIERCLDPDPKRRTRAFDMVLADLRRRKQRKPLLCRRPWKFGYLFKIYSQWASVRLFMVGLLILAGILGYRWHERQEALYASHVLKGNQANNSGRYEEAYLHWAQALSYRGESRPIEVRLRFRPLSAVLANQKPVTDFVLAGSGKQVVTAEESGLVTLRDIATGSTIGSWSHKDGINHLAMDPDGQILAMAGYGGVAAVDLDSGEQLLQQTDQGNPLEAVDFSHESRYLISADFAGTIQVYDLVSQGAVDLESVNDENYEGHFPILAPHPEKPRLASQQSGNRACVWDLTNGDVLVFSAAHNKAINDLAWLPETDLLLSAGEDSVVKLWNAADGKPIREFSHGNPVSVLLPLSSRTFASGCRDGSVQIWDIDNQEDPIMEIGLRRPVLTLTCDPSFEVLAVGTGEDQDLWSEAEANGTINLFSLRTGFQVGGPWPCEGPVTKVAFQPEQQRIVTLSSLGLRVNVPYPVYIRLWNYIVPEEFEAPVKPPEDPEEHPDKREKSYDGVAINDRKRHPDSGRLATAREDWTVRLYDAQTSEMVHRPFELRGPALGVAFSFTGDMLATATQEQRDDIDTPVRVRLWDTETGLQLSPILTCPGDFMSLEFKDDGSKLAATTTEGRFEWDLAPKVQVDWKEQIYEELKVELDKRGGLRYQAVK